MMHRPAHRNLLANYKTPKSSWQKLQRHYRVGRVLQLESFEERCLMAVTPVQVLVESLGPTGGLGQTPFWIGFHQGNFETGRAGALSANFGGLEELAEGGDVAPLSARFQTADPNAVDAVITAPGGFAGAPVFEPNESMSQIVTVTDSEFNQYFSFASMIIPSNDAFVANLNPTAFRIFDDAGELLGTRTIEIYGHQIWDSGTEVNSPTGGAAFSTEGGTSVDENGVIHLHLGLDDFIGTGLPTGDNLSSVFTANTPIARITISSATNPVGPQDTTAPLAELSAMNVAAQANSHTIEVIYSDPSGVDARSIGTADLRVDGPDGRSLRVIGVTTNAAAGTNPRTVVATYTVTPSDGLAFGADDRGSYRVFVNSTQVRDIAGNQVGEILTGSFDVDVAIDLVVTVENLSPLGGLAQTPFWVGFHDGSFEIGRIGEAASEFVGLEEIAELGDIAPLAARFSMAQSNGVDAVLTAPDGFTGAPVFEPGETVSQTIRVTDSHLNRYFSYASMVIPSNDAFVANLNSRALELFDNFGNFTGPRTIEIYGGSIWDAGTEVNSATGGAAFSTEGGTSVDENGVIHMHLGLDEFIGTGLPTGDNLLSAFTANTPIARITIRPAGTPLQVLDRAAPVAELAADTIVASGAATQTIQVTYTDPSGVDVSRIGVHNLRIDGSNGRYLRVVGVTTDATSGVARTVTATYTIEPREGDFAYQDNGFYRVVLRDRMLRDHAGNITREELLGEIEVAVGAKLKVTVENLTTTGGLAQTPFWVGFHDGSFEVAQLGASASNFGGLEEVAEEGDVIPLGQRFATSQPMGTSSVVTAPEGFAGAPVFEPGEIASVVVDVGTPSQNRFFSFASMIIPSNDAFLANLDPRGIELFDPRGEFQSVQTIEIFGRDVYDAGTEVNNAAGGAAFSTEGGTSVDENGLIGNHAGLAAFVGTGLPTGSTLQSAFSASTPLARITVCIDDGSATHCTARPSAVVDSSRDPRDVNDDGIVSALDVLLVVNFINGGQAAGEGIFFDFDIEKDGNVTALDALQIVNFLNVSVGSGEQSDDRRDQVVDYIFEDMYANDLV